MGGQMTKLKHCGQYDRYGCLRYTDLLAVLVLNEKIDMTYGKTEFSSSPLKRNQRMTCPGAKVNVSCAH